MRNSLSKSPSEDSKKFWSNTNRVNCNSGKICYRSLQKIPILITTLWEFRSRTTMSAVSKMLVFLFRCRNYYPYINIYSVRISQIRPSLTYSSLIWREAPPRTFSSPFYSEWINPTHQ